MSTGDPDADAVLADLAKPPAINTGDPDADAVLTDLHKQSTQSSTGEWGRAFGLAGRAVAQGVAALPLMAMDAGVATRNLITGEKYTSPSEMFRQSLDQIFPTPKTTGEKVINTIESGISGAAIPGPTSGINVPANFKTAEEARQAANLAGVKQGMEEGYVIPPSTSNPTFGNRAVESLAGKRAVEQQAALQNQLITNNLTKRALGLNEEGPLTLDAIGAVKAEAGKDIGAIKDVGIINLGPDFKEALQRTMGEFNATADEIPELANKDLQPIVDALTSKDQYSSKALVGAIRQLRTKADMAFRAGDGSTGTALKQISRHVEDAIDEDLSSRGGEYADLLDTFRSARQRYAIASTVEDAFNSSTGNVIARKLANEDAKNPGLLSGHLKTIADFAKSAPKSVMEPTSSPVSHTDVAVPALTAIFGHGIGEKVSGIGWPIVRRAARSYLLGPGQEGAIPEIGSNVAQIPGAVRGAPATLQSLRSILYQPQADDNER